MDQGQSLTVQQRYRIRWWLVHELQGLRRGPEELHPLINEYYPRGACRTYAHAFAEALRTVDPINLPSVRDSRS